MKKHNIRLNVLPLLAYAAVLSNRLVTVTSTGGGKHASPTDLVVGVSGDYDTPIGGTIDLARDGYLTVIYETAAVVGQPMTAGSDGKVKATTSDKAMFVSLTATQAGDVGSLMRVFAPAIVSTAVAGAS